jgi:hypothetical protein
MSDFLEGVPIELHENVIRRRLRFLEWIGVFCGCGIAGMLSGLLVIETSVTNYILLAVFISTTLVATFFYHRTKARLKR